MASSQSTLRLIVEGLEIPESAYDKAESRYKSLGKFLCREGSRVRHLDPYVYPQGSFLLGTVIRPIDDAEEYDLDLGCSLRIGVGKSTHSQKDLKELIGKELNDYRTAQQIQHELESKRRCWRLSYKDELRFHMDVVPCIPERGGEAGLIKEAMIERGASQGLASDVAGRMVSITDNELPSYPIISPTWLVSNMQGYGLWFQSRVELSKPVRDRIVLERRAEIDPIPNNRRKAPLQRVVQLLKRHRSAMYANDKASQPISIIITTLAALAYSGEATVEEALANVLATMGNFVTPTGQYSANGQPIWRVENPVNPNENFADKWPTEEGLALDLEGNFKWWLQEAQRDFRYFNESRDAAGLEERAESALGLKLDRGFLREQLGLPGGSRAPNRKPQPIVDPPGQWRRT